MNTVINYPRSWFYVHRWEAWLISNSVSLIVSNRVLQNTPTRMLDFYCLGLWQRQLLVHSCHYSWSLISIIGLIGHSHMDTLPSINSHICNGKKFLVQIPSSDIKELLLINTITIYPFGQSIQMLHWLWLLEIMSQLNLTLEGMHLFCRSHSWEEIIVQIIHQLKTHAWCMPGLNRIG